MPNLLKSCGLNQKKVFIKNGTIPTRSLLLVENTCLFRHHHTVAQITFAIKNTLVLLSLVDANYKFLVVDVGAFGKNSDASILRNSSLGKGLQDGTLNIPPHKIPPGGTELLPYVIVGDEAFPLCTYLMRPYSRHDVQISI